MGDLGKLKPVSHLAYQAIPAVGKIITPVLGGGTGGGGEPIERKWSFSEFVVELGQLVEPSYSPHSQAQVYSLINHLTSLCSGFSQSSNGNFSSLLLKNNTKQTKNPTQILWYFPYIDSSLDLFIYYSDVVKKSSKNLAKFLSRKILGFLDYNLAKSTKYLFFTARG